MDPKLPSKIPYCLLPLEPVVTKSMDPNPRELEVLLFVCMETFFVFGVCSCYLVVVVLGMHVRWWTMNSKSCQMYIADGLMGSGVFCLFIFVTPTKCWKGEDANWSGEGRLAFAFTNTIVGLDPKDHTSSQLYVPGSTYGLNKDYPL